MTQAAASDVQGWATRLPMPNLAIWPLALGLGAIQPLAVAPLHVVVALPIAFGGLFLLLERVRSLRGAFTLGWLFGVSSFLVGLSWITEAFAVDATRYGSLAWPAVLLLASGLALFPALSLFTARVLAGDRGGACLAAGLVAAWSAGEWLRGSILTGFPWNVSGYAWGVSNEFLQVTALVGIYGAGLFATTVAVLPALAYAHRRIWPAVLALSVLACVWSFGALRLTEPLPDEVVGARLRIVQPNVPQNLKWAEVERDTILARLLTFSVQVAENGSRPTHIVWPESAVPYLISEAPAVRLRIASALSHDTTLLTGAVRRTFGQDSKLALLNSIVALDTTGEITSTYDKVRLVPFGEYRPFRSVLAALPKLTIGDVDFLPGAQRLPLPVQGLPPAWPMICYEAIFPSRTPTGALAPGWILNVTNDAWFGTSWGPYQHALSARVRSIELGLPLVRAANSGISFVTDAYGRELARIPLSEAGVLDVTLPGAIEGTTTYARWGELPLALALMLLVATAIILRHRT